MPKARHPSSDSSVTPSSFKWTNEIKTVMAEYFAANYEAYKNVGDKGGRKLHFLRKMRDHLKLDCTDQQLKNGFNKFIGKYMEIRQKLNSSGFGVDPDIDSTIDKGWILKQCPYFNVLDEVMGTRANVTPPFVLASDGFGEIGVPEESVSKASTVLEAVGDTELIVPKDPDECDADTCVTDDGTDKTSPVAKLIKSSFLRLGVKEKPSNVPKSGLAIFAQMIKEKSDDISSVEAKKLKLDEEKFNHQKVIEEQRLTLEREKILADKELQRELIQDKRDERLHELKKLELQIQLEQLKAKNFTSN